MKNIFLTLAIILVSGALLTGCSLTQRLSTTDQQLENAPATESDMNDEVVEREEAMTEPALDENGQPISDQDTLEVIDYALERTNPTDFSGTELDEKLNQE